MPDNHVYRIIQVAGSSENSIEDAIQNAVGRASRTLRQVGWFEVLETRGHVEDGKVAHYQGSNPAPSSGESGANLTFGARRRQRRSSGTCRRRSMRADRSQRGSRSGATAKRPDYADKFGPNGASRGVEAI
jgi:dodecin